MNLVTYRVDHHIAFLQLNRADKLNALSAEMLDALIAKLDHYASNDDVRVVVISGTERAFSAGADTGTLANCSSMALYRSGFSEKWDRIAAFEKPLIAAITGYALGGGLELALLCDIVLAGESASLGLPESQIGIIPGAGGTQRLVKSLGKSLAMEMLLTGRRLTASEALAAGLVSQVVPDVQLMEAAQRTAEKVAAAAPLAAKLIKRTVLASYEMPLSAGIAFERALSALIADSEDRAIGMQALALKQKPQFTGR